MNRRDALKRSALALGAAAGAPTLLSLLQACAKTDRLTWTPVFLSEDQARFISSFVDFLLPKTDTPGGLDVKADVFIDLMYAKTYDEAGQKQVVADIEAKGGKAIALPLPKLPKLAMPSFPYRITVEKKVK